MPSRADTFLFFFMLLNYTIQIKPGWDFRDDWTEFALFVFLLLGFRIGQNCIISWFLVGQNCIISWFLIGQKCIISWFSVGQNCIISWFFVGQNCLISVLNYLVNHQNTQLETETKNQPLNRHIFKVFGRL